MPGNTRFSCSWPWLEGGSLYCDSYQLISGLLMMDSGKVYPWNGLTISTAGLLVGGGSIYGNVINFGTVSMSHLGLLPTAMLTIWGDYSQRDTGMLFVTVKGHQLGDFLSVSGTASLDGTLMVYLDGTFEVGDVCGIMDYTGLQGGFAEVVGTGNNLNWLLTYGDQMTSLHL